MLGIFKKAKFIFLVLLGAAVCIWIFFNSTAIGLMLVYLLIIYLLVIKFDGFCEAISIKPSEETPSLLFGAAAQVFALLLIAFCVFVLSIPSDELSSKPVFEYGLGASITVTIVSKIGAVIGLLLGILIGMLGEVCCAIVSLSRKIQNNTK